MRRTRTAALTVLLLLPPLLAACGGGEEPAAEPAGGAIEDGLSPEQIREQAEPMSPERAEALGIIDTTIHLEKLTSPGDSALLADTVRPPLGVDTVS